jgi:secreted PhoX family phosphatase
MLRGSGATLAASVVGTFGAVMTRRAQAQAACSLTSMTASPYGPIAPVNDLATGLPLLRLPAGFSYRSFGWTNDPMAGGPTPTALTPGNHDGMAVVETRRVGRSIEHVLIRNHELALAPALLPGPTYDSFFGTVPGFGTGVAAGGTTTLVVRDGQLVSTTASLNGTLANCAGGTTPWGTWLTCEETVFDLTPLGGKRHGYVFEVDPDPAFTSAVPIIAMGRMAHEAVAVDPATGYVYETEDSSRRSGFYRYIPSNPAREPGALEDGGRLFAARIKRIVASRYTTLTEANALGMSFPCIGDTFELEWVEITANADDSPRNIVVPANNTGSTTASVSASGPFAAAWAQGCARMLRGEGIWASGGKLFIVDTSAGGDGCLWEYTPSTELIRCFYLSSSQAAGNNVDNVTVSPRGGILLCEDGGASSVDVFNGLSEPGARLVGLTRDGLPFMFAKNNTNFTAAQYAAAGKTAATLDSRGAEFAGACFDPTGRILYVNNYVPGITFAITGPWTRGPF